MDISLRQKHKFIHFFYCPFIGLGLYGGYRGERWLKNRIQIFKQFVMPSLLNQSKKEFIIWISFRSEDKENQIIKDFMKSLNGIRETTFVFTFGGLCFWDDKYPKEIAKQRLLNSFEKTLPKLKPYIPEDYSWVAMTIQPSDDCYFYRFVEDISKTEFKEKAVQFTNGYIMNYLTKELREYNPWTTPPFYTIFFKRDTFLDSQKHFDYCGKVESHEYVKNFLPIEYWGNRGFMVGTHTENISTYFNHPYAGSKVGSPEEERVMFNFGIYDAPVLIIKKSWRKQLFRLLPYNWQKKLRYIFGQKCYNYIYDWIRN